MYANGDVADIKKYSKLNYTMHSMYSTTSKEPFWRFHNTLLFYSLFFNLNYLFRFWLFFLIFVCFTPSLNSNFISIIFCYIHLDILSIKRNSHLSFDQWIYIGRFKNFPIYILRIFDKELLKMIFIKGVNSIDDNNLVSTRIWWTLGGQSIQLV